MALRVCCVVLGTPWGSGLCSLMLCRVQFCRASSEFWGTCAGCWEERMETSNRSRHALLASEAARQMCDYCECSEREVWGGGARGWWEGTT